VGSNGTGAWMFISFMVFLLSDRGLCDWPIPHPEEFHRLWCVSECDQVKIKILYTYCEKVDKRGKDYETKPSDCEAVVFLSRLALQIFIITVERKRAWS
jgi:hypothetical protein